MVAVKEMLDGSDRAPGDYGFDPLKFSAGKSDAVKKDLQAKEIENGRYSYIHTYIHSTYFRIVQKKSFQMEPDSTVYVRSILIGVGYINHNVHTYKCMHTYIHTNH